MRSGHQDFEIRHIPGEASTHRAAIVDIGDPFIAAATAKDTSFFRRGGCIVSVRNIGILHRTTPINYYSIVGLIPGATTRQGQRQSRAQGYKTHRAQRQREHSQKQRNWKNVSFH
jgi:hypothetical protein